MCACTRAVVPEYSYLNGSAAHCPVQSLRKKWRKNKLKFNNTLLCLIQNTNILKDYETLHHKVTFSDFGLIVEMLQTISLIARGKTNQFSRA